MTHEMMSDIVAAAIIAFCILLYYFYSLIEDYKMARDLENIAKNQPDLGKHVDFFDEIKSHMEAEMDCKLTYADPYLSKWAIYKSFGASSRVNGKKIDSEYIQIRFILKVFKDGRREIQAESKNHRGRPYWDGKEMHYNYPMGEALFSADVNDFKTLWQQIIEHYFSVKLNGVNDRILIRDY